MKLLMLLPNLVLIAISGVNLSNEFAKNAMVNNLAVIVLHLSVLIMCIVFVALIVKSMFKVKYTEIPEQDVIETTDSYEEYKLRSV